MEAREKSQPAIDAEDDRDANAPVHGRNEMTAAALPEKCETDGNDEKGFEPFAERDDECLEHESRPKVRFSLNCEVYVELTVDDQPRATWISVFAVNF